MIAWSGILYRDIVIICRVVHLSSHVGRMPEEHFLSLLLGLCAVSL